MSKTQEACFENPLFEVQVSLILWELPTALPHDRRPSQLGPTLPLLAVAPCARAGVWKDRKDSSSATQLHRSFILGLRWSMAWLRRLALIYLAATGALASAVTSSSAVVVIVSSLDQNPSFFVLMFLSSATGSWMKASKEYYNALSASSPCLDSQGRRGLSDCRYHLLCWSARERSSAFLQVSPPTPASARAVSLAKAMSVLLLFSQTGALKTSDLATSLVKAARSRLKK